MIIENHPFLNINFESVGLECVMVVVQCGNGYGKPTVRHMPTRPPARRGSVIPVRIRNGRRTRNGTYVEDK